MLSELYPHRSRLKSMESLPRLDSERVDASTRLCTTLSVMMRVVEGGPQWNFLSTPVGQWISRPRTSSRVRGPQSTWRQLSCGTVPVLSVALIESLTSA